MSLPLWMSREMVSQPIPRRFSLCMRLKVYGGIRPFWWAILTGYQGHADLLSDETSTKVQFFYPCFILLHNRLKCPIISFYLMNQFTVKTECISRARFITFMCKIGGRCAYILKYPLILILLQFTSSQHKKCCTWFCVQCSVDVWPTEHCTEVVHWMAELI